MIYVIGAILTFIVSICVAVHKSRVAEAEDKKLREQYGIDYHDDHMIVNIIWACYASAFWFFVIPYMLISWLFKCTGISPGDLLGKAEDAVDSFIVPERRAGRSYVHPEEHLFDDLI